MSFNALKAGTALALLAVPAAAAEMHFNRVASFPVVRNMAADENIKAETSAEIIDATEDGMTLVYSDSPLGALDGFQQGARP